MLLLLILTLKFSWLRDVCVDQGWVMLMECCNIFPSLSDREHMNHQLALKGGGMLSPAASLPL